MVDEEVGGLGFSHLLLGAFVFGLFHLYSNAMGHQSHATRGLLELGSGRILGNLQTKIIWGRHYKISYGVGFIVCYVSPNSNLKE